MPRGIVPVLVTATPDVLAAAGDEGLLTAEDADLLSQAYAKLRDLFQWMRLSVPGAFDPKTSGEGLRRRAAAILGLPDFKVLERDLEGHPPAGARDLRADHGGVGLGGASAGTLADSAGPPAAGAVHRP